MDLRRCIAVAAILLPLLSAGCATASAPGWYRIAPGPGVSYAKSLTAYDLDGQTPPCDLLTKDVPASDHPIYVFVHGFGGDNDEWHDVPPLLARTQPAGMFMFRWSTSGNRNVTEGLLAGGISHLVECFAGRAGPVVLLAHSAGGFVASYASSRIKVPAGVPHPAVYIMTVASPLSMGLTSTLGPFPRAADGVLVAHLRTSYPADFHMQPNNGRLPDDPSVGVVGARQIALPANLSHDASIMYAVRRFADGTWREWFAGP